MNSRVVALILVSALPGYHFQFPQDHFNHPNYQTEWWYYTGNLQSADGHHYGYELTFFRQVNAQAPKSESVWSAEQVYLAHLALSDVDGQHFEHYERLSRAGPGLAGADLGTRSYWNGNWRVRWISDAGVQELEAVAPDFTLRLKLEPAKPFVIHGVDGIVQKGAGVGNASHYISFTRLVSEGTLRRGSNVMAVKGTSWMDHEFFTVPQDADLQGWDWFAVQLDNGEELMLYEERSKSGAVSRYSSGTLIDAQGRTRHLTAEDFKLTPGRIWRSEQSGARYPVEWKLEVPSVGISLSERTRLDGQELVGRQGGVKIYWEGAVEYWGVAQGQGVHGVGYLEMTGYAEAVRLGG